MMIFTCAGNTTAGKSDISSFATDSAIDTGSIITGASAKEMLLSEVCSILYSINIIMDNNINSLG